MIRKPDTENVINLDGTMGNVFYLMARANRMAKALGMNNKKIVNDMEHAGSYHDAIKIFYKNFGHMVIIETENQELFDICNQLENV